MSLTDKNSATERSRVTYYGKTHHRRGFERRGDFPVCRSCKELMDAGITTSGKYMIYPDGSSVGLEVECDMTTDGGGWTRMVSELGDLSGATWENENNIVGYNQATSCSSYIRRNFLFNNIKIPWEENRLDFTREGSIMQCPRFVDYANRAVLPEMRSFKIEDDGSETSWGMCLWGDNVWAYRCCSAYLGSLHKKWRFYQKRALNRNNYFSFFSTCSNSDDSGRYTSTLWLR